MREIREYPGGTQDIMEYMYDQNGRPYAFVLNNTIYYYVLNLQGDVVRLVNTSGTTVASYTYNAYGKLLSTATTSVSNSATVAEKNPIRYRGYYYDNDIKLYYCQSRYYDPTLGRFLNPDAFTSTGQGIFGNNMYGYCENNPVNFEDPFGTYMARYDSFLTPVWMSIGGNATGVSSASPSGSPDGIPFSIGGLLSSIIDFFKKPDDGTLNKKQNQPYNYNGRKSEKYVLKRGWTDDMIQYAIESGQQGKSINAATNSSSTVFKYPGTNNQYVVIDDTTGSIVQVSDFHDPGWIVDSRIQWAP